jgi:hypothetical protein
MAEAVTLHAVVRLMPRLLMPDDRRSQEAVSQLPGLEGDDDAL